MASAARPTARPVSMTGSECEAAIHGKRASGCRGRRRGAWSTSTGERHGHQYRHDRGDDPCRGHVAEHVHRGSGGSGHGGGPGMRCRQEHRQEAPTRAGDHGDAFDHAVRQRADQVRTVLAGHLPAEGYDDQHDQQSAHAGDPRFLHGEAFAAIQAGGEDRTSSITVVAHIARTAGLRSRRSHGRRRRRGTD